MMQRLVQIGMDEAQIERMSVGARLVLKTFPSSPAHVLGIGPGWRLLRMGASAPTDEAILAAETGKPTRYLFANATGNQAFELGNVSWPFGMVTVPWPDRSLGRRISSGRYDREELTRFWKEGALAPYARFALPLERYLSSPFLGVIGNLIGSVAPRETIARHDDYYSLMLLAMSKTVAGQWDDANYYLAATRASRIRANQASYSTIHMSMDYYIESMIADAAGDGEKALATAREAKRLVPDIKEVETRLAKLEGRAAQIATPRWTFEQFPVPYVLPAHDPVGEIKNNTGSVSYREMVDTLAPGEMLVILVLGSYRSNTYYNLDLVRLAMLNKAFPGRIREVHAITSGTYALDVGHRHACEIFASEHGLPFAILWDEDDEISMKIAAEGSPARFLVDRTGTIYATERLMEEEGFWKAIHRMEEQQAP